MSALRQIYRVSYLRAGRERHQTFWAAEDASAREWAEQLTKREGVELTQLKRVRHRPSRASSFRISGEPAA